MRPFHPSDLDEINNWYSAHNLPPMKLSLLPKIGFIEPNVAAAFLYQTDSRLAIIENFISNPESDSVIRGKAIDKIADMLVEIAQSLGVELIVGMTQSKSIEKLAYRHGFQSLGEYKMVSLEMRK
jgi:sugar phosphate isomerase/epimerase